MWATETLSFAPLQSSTSNRVFVTIEQSRKACHSLAWPAWLLWLVMKVREVLVLSVCQLSHVRQCVNHRMPQDRCACFMLSALSMGFSMLRWVFGSSLALEPEAQCVSHSHLGRTSVCLGISTDWTQLSFSVLDQTEHVVQNCSRFQTTL